MGLAALASVLIGFNARFTRRYIWDRVPPAVERNRWAHCGATTLVLTAGGIALLLPWGIAGESRQLLQAFLLFLPWAFLQQTLFQFYLLGRLRTLWPTLPPPALSALNGLAFGLVHLPDLVVALLAALGGTAWSLLYFRYRLLLPLAASQAALGATFFTWVRGRQVETWWIPTG